MPPLLRSTLAVITGLVIGSCVNMGLILMSEHVIPLPPGVDNKSMEGLKASIHLFEPKHFVFPFLAHALGTLVGALVATSLSPQRNLTPAWVVGCLFLLGGTINILMLPAPMWFNLLDLVVAYIPMAWLGHWLVSRRAAPKISGT